MQKQTFKVARKYGAKMWAPVVGAGALLASAAAFAQATDPGAVILDKVNTGFTTAEEIATAVVLGLFGIWAIKLLFRGK